MTRKTPCEELGYKVGDLFEVIWDETFSLGSIVVLAEDDGSVSPYFTLIEGEVFYGSANGACQHIDKIKPYTPHQLQDLPTEDFKINLSNMTDVEKSIAKEWLNKVAESRGLGSKYLSDDDEYVVNYVWIDMICGGGQGLRVKGYNVATDKDYYEQVDLPELSLSFTTPEVKGWELSDNKSEKELQLEQTIDKLQAALEEAEEQLQSIKNN